jgi:dolichol-phosphate mannosyltransferase
MKLSVIIPAHNEEFSISETLQSLNRVLQRENIEHEILVVNDNSNDNTLKVLKNYQGTIDNLRIETNTGPSGFGFAVRYGLERFSGDCVAIMMADMSDDPEDLVKFYRKMVTEKLDCVFGSRWMSRGLVFDYPLPKRILNRIFNSVVRLMFRLKYDDLTNAFKLYSKETIAGLKPLISPHFNLTLELPLKAVVRGYSYEVLPNSWRNRKHGESKLKIKEMGSRYVFILLYCLIEKYFSRGDFKKSNDINRVR